MSDSSEDTFWPFSLTLIGSLTSQLQIILVLFLSFLVVFNWTRVHRFLAKFWLRRQGYLQDLQGNPIPEVQGETRFSRFSHGYELSQTGARVAGDRPYIIWNGAIPEVVLTQAEHVKQFYSKASQEHFKPENACMGHYFSRVMGEAMGVKNGAIWKSIRRAFDPYFSYQSAMGFSEIFTTELKKWIDDMSSQVGQTDGFVVEATTACTILPFKLIALACYGPAMTDNRFAELLALNSVHERVLLTTWFGRKQLNRLYNVLPTTSKKEMDTFESEWKRFNLSVMQEAKMRDLHCPAAEIYQAVLAGTITEAAWLQSLDEILFTNLDVTSAILAFLLINLSINQAVQSELRAEILQNSRGFNEPGTESSPVENYIRRTDTLLEYTCLESGRLCPAVWFTLPEYTGADIDIGGYRIKAGTNCIIDWARLNTESPLWNPEKRHSGEPEVNGRMFYPQRFQSMSTTTYRWSMLRFGLGGRQCIGKNFASRIMKQFLLEVLTRYRVELDGARPVKQWGTINVELRDDRFTVMPKQNVRFVEVKEEMGKS